jgi:hypothetical protein
LRPRKYFVGPPQAVKTYGEREVCQGNAAGKREYKARTERMQKRQGGHCALCQWYLGLEFDHQSGRGSGAGHRDDRIVVDGHWHNAALCRSCNSEKGSKRYQWVNGKYVEVVKQREVA